MTQPSLVTLFNFDGASGSLPFGSLVEDANGNFYGATYSGGAYGEGVIYEISALTHNFTVLASFNGTTEGGNPIGTLSVDAAGNLYGETENSGAPQRVQPIAGELALTVDLPCVRGNDVVDDLSEIVAIRHGDKPSIEYFVF